MSPDRYLEAVRLESARLISAAGHDLDVPVPTCPGWTMGDLVGHTGAVHRHKTAIINGRLTSAIDHPEPPEAGVIDWFLEGVDLLLAALSSTEPETPVWTWDETDQSVGFWQRRMAHETAVHRADAELAHGPANPVDPDLATDGIDELITVMLTGVPAWGRFSGSGQTVTVGTEDTSASWSLEFGRFKGTSPVSGTTLDISAAELTDATPTDAQISGSASDVFLWLWGRGDISRLTVTGAEEMAGVLRMLAIDAT